MPAVEKVEMQWDKKGESRHASCDRWITPEGAREILSTCVYPGQRTVILPRVRYLADEMAAGTFLEGAISFAQLPDGERYLIDGYHRLHAMILSGAQYLFTVMTYPASDMEEVSRKYGRIDRGTGRSVGQVLGYLAPELGISKQDIGRVAAAMRQIAARFGVLTGPTSADWSRDAIRGHAQAVTDTLNVFKNQPAGLGRLFRQSTVLGMAILTVSDAQGSIAREQALSYWHDVGHMDGLPRLDPRWWAFRHITETSVSSMGVTQKTVISTRLRSHYLATCWNHWCANRTTVKGVKVPDLSQPVRLLRTRYAS